MLRDWRGGRKAAKEGRGEGGGVDRGWGERGDSVNGQRGRDV